MVTSIERLQRRAGGRLRLVVWLIVALALGAVIAVFVGRAVARQEAPSPRPELQEILDGLVTGPQRIAPGATAFVSGPKGTWLGAAGTADLATGEPMPPDARMRLESVSKIYTAVLVLQLAQDGRLRVEDTVERWLPGLLPYGDEITIRQLLSMTSGLIDNNDLARSEADLQRYLARVEDAGLRAELLATARRVESNPALEVSPMLWIRFAAWQPLLFEPGTQFHYSNIGYEVLGLIAARAGGEPLPELYRERIFTPLGLEDTAYDPQGPIAGPHAKGYALGAGSEPVDATEHHLGVGAEGGIVAKAEETAAFLTGLMSGRLLGEERLASLKVHDLWRGGDQSCVGPAFGWSGGGSGYKTEVWVNGDGTRVAVLLLNARVPGDGQGVADGVARGAMARLFCRA